MPPPTVRLLQAVANGTLLYDYYDLDGNVTGSGWNSTFAPDDAGNGNGTSTTDPDHLKHLSNFHLVKAIVLSSVTVVVLLSIAKMVFGMALRYPGDKADK